MRIEWVTGGDVHTIPDEAVVTFILNNGKAKVRFQIKTLSDGTEYMEREVLDGEIEIIDRRVGMPDRREKCKE